MNSRMEHFAVLFWTLFHLVYGECDVKIAVKSGEDIELTSPKYPSNFSQHLHCFYDLTTQFNSGDILHVSVLDVTFACDDQDTSLEVFDAFSGSTKSLGKICAGGVTKFVSPKERLYLVFRSGSNLANQNTGRGFKLNVMAVPEFSHCYNHQAKVLSVTPETQHIVSPYYPVQVAPNVHCRWLLKAPSGQRVLLDILSADMKDSNSCSRFGLHIFDGKTTYDDRKIGTVCSNESGSFHSTSNYMMVVFSSGAHVMHSGGGVKLGYYSTFADSDVVEKDSSLLFILIGVLLALASFTIIMVVLRFIVIPTRRQALNRQYCPRNSNIRLSSAAATSRSNDPPPPYHQTDLSIHRQKRKGLWASTFGCCFPGGKSIRENNSQLNIRNCVNDFPYVSGNGELRSGTFVTPHLLSALAGYARNTALSLNQLPSGTSTVADLQGYFNSRETTSNMSINPGQNEYHELPVLPRLEIVSGAVTNVTIGGNSVSESCNVEGSVSSSSHVEHSVSNFFPVEYSIRNISPVGQYTSNSLNLEQSASNSTLGQSVSNSSHLVLANKCQINDSVYVICAGHAGGSSNDTLSDGLDNSAQNVSISGSNSTSGVRDNNNDVTVSLDGAGHEGNARICGVDDSGYEVPAVPHIYDQLREGGSGDDGEDGDGEGVYHTLQFSSEEASIEESER